ncbi:MAG TPA: hypothetical protein VMT05_13365 [Terriglobales bacterium]|jgi:hypothetical protein|nr:hypothetical protein [Terriglobales bacterium]
MRSVTFLLSLGVVGALVLAQTLSNPLIGRGQVRTVQQSGGSNRMLRRAEIRVVPLDLYLANTVELDSLRARVEQTQADVARLELPEPATRELLFRQQQLLKALLNLAQRQESNAGKGPTVLEVQRHLNEIEGKVMCEACHTGIVARQARAR